MPCRRVPGAAPDTTRSSASTCCCPPPRSSRRCHGVGACSSRPPRSTRAGCGRASAARLVVTDTAHAPDDSIGFGGPTWLEDASGTTSTLVVVSPLAEMLAVPLPQASVYVACLRNLEVTADTIARRHSRVAVLGAGERGEVCTEDQMVASWLADAPAPPGLRARGAQHHAGGGALGLARRDARRLVALRRTAARQRPSRGTSTSFWSTSTTSTSSAWAASCATRS